MRRIAIIAAIVCLIGGLVAIPATAQQPPLDLGTAPLASACSNLIAYGESQGLVVNSCRRYEPDVITGNHAELVVRIATDRGNFVVDVVMHRSLWQTDSYNSR